MNSVFSYRWDNLGRCVKCMRTAFKIGIGASITFIGCSTFFGSYLVTYFTGGAAIVAISLWISHILAFSIRSTSRAVKPAHAVSGLRSRRNPAARLLVH